MSVCLAAAANPEPLRLGTPGLTYVDFPEAKGELILDRLSKQLELQGVRVTGKAEIAALLGLERQKALLGCADEGSSCIAELAFALGVDGLLTGSLGRAGSGYLVNLKVVAGSDARTLAVVSGRVDDEDALLDFLDRSAAELAKQLFGSTGREAPKGLAPTERAFAFTDLWPLPFAVGLVCIGGGVAMWLSALQTQQAVRKQQITFADERALDAKLREGRNFETVAWVLAGTGAALTVAGIAMGIRGHARVTVAPGAGGGLLLISGDWP